MRSDISGISRQQLVGVDLGGSAIKIGTFLSDGTLTDSLSIPTPQPPVPEIVIEAIATAVNRFNRDRNCLAIGFGTPGPVDSQRRIAKVSINLPSWNNVPVADWLEAKTQLPTWLENDANCAAMGEAWLGAGRQFRHFILLTLGTGVGGAIFIDGKLFTGRCGAAGELGLITLYPNGYSCRSGNRGSLEQSASIGAILRQTGKDPAELGRLAKLGERAALEFWSSYGRSLGVGLASLIYVLTPEAVIFGGGISASAEFFMPAAFQEIERRVLPTSRPDLQLLTAELGNKAGMLGAAKLAWQMNSQQ